jgi:DNA-binding winged helix-turn-helix (wHTH) protein/Tol biopolymer transport system component
MGFEIKSLYRFEGFEMDPGNRILTRGGNAITIPPRAFDLLLYMVENPQRLLGKEELLSAIWTDVVVEESNLTQNVFLLRKALAAHGPEFGKLIVTSSGRGYRFAGLVEQVEVTRPQPVPDQATNGGRPPDRTGEPAAPRNRHKIGWLIAGTLAAAAAALAFLPRVLHRPLNQLVPLPHPVTMNSAENPVGSVAISPDGRYLAYATSQSVTVQTLKSNETRSISLEAGAAPTRVAWFPDGTRLLVGERKADLTGLMVFSLLSGKLSPLRDDAMSAAISADGNRVVYTDSTIRQLWLMDGNGEHPRQILTVVAPDKMYPMFWSPDSMRIWFARVHWDKDKETITLETCDVNGASRTVALSDNHATAFRLLPQGRLLFARAEEPSNFTNLWELPVNAIEGKAEGPARKLTNWTNFSISGISSTADGKQLALLNGAWQADVYTGDLHAGGAELSNTRRLTLDQSDDIPAFWTPDNRAVVFTSNRNGRTEIFRQRLDQTAPELISTDAESDEDPRFAGQWIYFRQVAAGARISWDQPLSLRRLPLNGGASTEVLRDVGIDVHCAERRPDVCVLAKLRNKVLSFYRFDQARGQGAEIGNMEFDSRLFPSFQVSPDGAEIAALNPRGAGNRIRRIPMNGGAWSEIEVAGREELTDLCWTVDGIGWFVSSRTPANGQYLLHVNPQGGSQVLYEQPEDGRDTLGIPSHDGQYLAFLRWTAAKNVWMIDGFQALAHARASE